MKRLREHTYEGARCSLSSRCSERGKHCYSLLAVQAVFIALSWHPFNSIYSLRSLQGCTSLQRVDGSTGVCRAVRERAE